LVRKLGVVTSVAKTEMLFTLRMKELMYRRCPSIHTVHTNFYLVMQTNDQNVVL